MKIQTKSGFVCDVKEKKAKDWRFCKALADCDSKSESKALQGLAFVVPWLLGEDGESKLMEHLADKDGIVPTDKVIAEFREVLFAIGAEVKKSQSSQE